MMAGWIARAGQHARLSGGLHHNTGWKVNERPAHTHTDRHTPTRGPKLSQSK